MSRRPAFQILLLLLTISFVTALPSTGSGEREAVANNKHGQQEAVAPRTKDPAEILRSARTIFIRTRTRRFKPATLVSELQKRPEFKRWGLLIATKESAADLIIEVHRVRFTNKFPYKVIDPRAGLVVDSGNVNSFGGTVAGEIAKEFVQKMLVVRPLPAPPTER